MKKRAISVILVLVLVFSVLPVSSLAAAPDYDPYTALGDSISWGYQFGDSDIYHPELSQPRSYVALAAGQLGISTVHNDSILAMDSSDLLKLLNCSNPITDLPGFFGAPQELAYYSIKGDIAGSDLITVAIGSNDLTMTVLDIIFQCIYPFVYGNDDGTLTDDEILTDAELESFTPIDHVIALNVVFEVLKQISTYFEGMSMDAAAGSPAALSAASMSPEKIEEICAALAALKPVNPLQEAVCNFENNWDGIITAIRTANPDATIAAIGYYNPFPLAIPLKNGTSIDLGFQCYIDQMNAYISGSGGCTFGHHSGVLGEYTYVDVSDAGQPGSNITLCGSDPHPTAAGHVEIANRLLAALPDDDPDDPPPVYYSVTPSYSIEAAASAGGSISPSGRTSVNAGANSTFTITPDADFVIDYVLVDDVRVDKTSTYTFKNVQASHKIYAAFKQNPFIDVGLDDWFHDEVLFLFGNDLINGITATTFEPNTSTSRAMIAQMLYRMANAPDVAYTALYSDVAENAWYADAVIWASENGIIAGYENGTFGPGDVITREQLVTSLFNFADYMGYDTSASKELTAYADSATVSDWAKDAMQWAVAIGLIKGTGEDQLSPDGASTRAVVAAIFYRFMEKY